MDKRGFHKMFGGVIALIIVVLIIIYIVVTPRTRQSLEQLSQQETTEVSQQYKQKQESKNPSLSAEQSNNNVKDPQSNEQSLSQKQLSALENELLPRQYHDDLYIEAQSIVSEQFLCFIMDLTPSINSRLNTSFANSGRETMLKQTVDGCKKVLQNHPHLTQQGENLGQLLEPTSALGKMIKDLNYRSDNTGLTKDFIFQNFLAVIKSKNGPLIASQANMPFVYFSRGEFIPISSWVNSKDPQYIQQLFQLSFSKLACRYQGGIACQPQGMIMTINCLSHQSACGLDFQNYYQQTILPGMQKDVDILVEKFEAMAE